MFFLERADLYAGRWWKKPGTTIDGRQDEIRICYHEESKQARYEERPRRAPARSTVSIDLTLSWSMSMQMRPGRLSFRTREGQTPGRVEEEAQPTLSFRSGSIQISILTGGITEPSFEARNLGDIKVSARRSSPSLLHSLPSDSHRLRG